MRRGARAMPLAGIQDAGDGDDDEEHDDEEHDEEEEEEEDECPDGGGDGDGSRLPAGCLAGWGGCVVDRGSWAESEGGAWAGLPQGLALWCQHPLRCVTPIELLTAIAPAEGAA